MTTMCKYSYCAEFLFSSAPPDFDLLASVDNRGANPLHYAIMGHKVKSVRNILEESKRQGLKPHKYL